MTKFKAVLELPVEDLKERRKVLENELKLVVQELSSIKITEEVLSKLNNGLNSLPFTKLELEWDFYPESDDEGGSIYYPDGLNIESNGSIEGFDIDEIDELIVQTKSSHSDTVYDEKLRDVLMEILCDYSSDLYDYNVYSITINFEEVK